MSELTRELESRNPTAYLNCGEATRIMQALDTLRERVELLERNREPYGPLCLCGHRGSQHDVKNWCVYPNCGCCHFSEAKCEPAEPEGAGEVKPLPIPLALREHELTDADMDTLFRKAEELKNNPRPPFKRVPERQPTPAAPETPAAATGSGWTGDVPTKAGWYWWRSGPEFQCVIRQVALATWDPLVVECGDGWKRVSVTGGEWAGPIPPPGHAADAGVYDRATCEAVVLVL